MLSTSRNSSSDGRGHDGGNALGDHRFSRAGRPDHQQISIPGHGHLDGAAQGVLALDLGEIADAVFALGVGQGMGSGGRYFGGTYILGMKKLQWILLLSGIAFGFALLLSEKFIRTSSEQTGISTPSLRQSIIFIIAVSAVIYVFRGLFSRYELISLYIKFIPAILLTVVQIFKSLPEIRIQLAATSFLAVPLILVSQTFPRDSVKKSKPIENFYRKEVKSYTKIDFSTSFGDYYSDVATNPQQSECGNLYSFDDYKHKFSLAGTGISKIKLNNNIITTYGINLFGGTYQENNMTEPWNKTFFLVGIGPYFKYDRKWIGLGMGFQTGNLRWVPSVSVKNDQTYVEDITKFSPILPEGYFRIGRSDILDLRYNFGFNSPSSLPVLVNELSIGTGLGYRDSFNLRYGIGVGYNYINFITAEALISRQFGIKLRYNFGKTDIFPTTYNQYNFSWLSLGVNYRFGFKK